MNDAGHVALDQEGAAIMRCFQSRLTRLQEEMEREPGRHWQILPRDLAACGSAQLEVGPLMALASLPLGQDVYSAPPSFRL